MPFDIFYYFGIIIKYKMETYRSGHNEADSKSVSRLKPARGFESHRLRQIKRGGKNEYQYEGWNKDDYSN